nr:LicD family protein [uncultured Desulfobacter sp.]
MFNQKYVSGNAVIKLSTHQLRKLQLTELEMLIELDRICNKCNIKYNIIGGTLLGAIRHGGFIPWDDDADVAMMRNEYEKFREACKVELDASRFYFQDYRNTKGYRWSYGKIRRKNTLFLRKNQEHMPYGQEVFIDVFPIDKAPDNDLHRKIYNFHLFCIRKILWSAIGRYSEQNLCIKYLYKLLYLIPRSTTIKHYERYINKINSQNYKRARFVLMPCPNKTYGYYLDWFKHSSEYEFEGIKLKGIKDYKEFLTFEFGNYMKFPPVEKRKVHPVSKLKLL